MKLSHRSFKWFLFFYPPYFFTRTRPAFIAPDFREIVIKIKPSFLNRNYVGTMFGGTLYAACDPFFMLMTIKNLGIEDYIIWDKAAEIDFKKPVRTTITFRFILTPEDLEEMRTTTDTKGKILKIFHVSGVDEEGNECVSVKKIVYVRKKEKGG